MYLHDTIRAITDNAAVSMDCRLAAIAALTKDSRDYAGIHQLASGPFHCYAEMASAMNRIRAGL